jgi:hypothetical protein
MAFSGEFPFEIVCLIKDYSMPCFRYWREYKDAMRELNRKEWPDIKKKLSGPNGAQVLLCLQRYLAARELSEVAYRAYKIPDRTLTSEEEDHVRTEYYIATDNRLTILGELLEM